MKKFSILLIVVLIAGALSAQENTSRFSQKPSNSPEIVLKDIQATLLTEDFEGTTFPPTDWTVNNFHSDPTCNWHREDDGTGNFVAQCLYADVNMMQERITSPAMNFSTEAGITLSFAFYTSFYWFVDPYDGADVTVEVSVDGGTTWTPIWQEEDYGTFENWTWYDVTLPLTAYEGQSSVLISFYYYGNDGAQFMLDNVVVASTTNIEENEISLNVFPNPVSDFISMTQNADVQLFNVFGQEVLSLTDVNSIDVSSLPCGTYMLRMNIGEEFYTKKIQIIR